MARQSPRSQWSSPEPGWNSGQDHSNQVEHRLTRAELRIEDQYGSTKKVKARLFWHEKALHAIAAVLYMLVSGKAHEHVPTLVDILLRVMGMPTK